MKPSTYRRNYFFGESVKKVFGSDSRIEAFTENYIRESIISLDKAPDQKNELLKRLKSILRWGYTHDYIGDISYLDKIERFKTESQRSKIVRRGYCAFAGHDSPALEAGHKDSGSVWTEVR